MSVQEKIVLSASQVKYARTVIDAFAADFKKAKAGIGSMSNHLLDLAKLAQKEGKTKAVDLYKALCRSAETEYKQAHLGPKEEELPIKKLLPFWPVAKSQVLAGLNAGLKLEAFKTVYEVVDATPKATRAANPTNGAADDTGSISMPKGAAGEALAKAHQRFIKTLKAIVVQKPQLIEATAKAVEAFVDSLDEMAQLEEAADVNGTNNADTSGIPHEKVA